MEPGLVVNTILAMAFMARALVFAVVHCSLRSLRRTYKAATPTGAARDVGRTYAPKSPVLQTWRRPAGPSRLIT